MNDGLLHAGEVLVRVAVSVVVGASIGLNRWLRHKPAGFGTHGLVSLGAALAIMTAMRVPGGDAAAVTRVAQGLVTGVGFIGAGVIMREGSREIHGLTTAASIWTSAILGIACGAADFIVVGIGFFFALGVLILSKPCEDLMARVLKRDQDHEMQHGGEG